MNLDRFLYREKTFWKPGLQVTKQSKTCTNGSYIQQIKTEPDLRHEDFDEAYKMKLVVQTHLTNKAKATKIC